MVGSLLCSGSYLLHARQLPTGCARPFRFLAFFVFCFCVDQRADGKSYISTYNLIYRYILSFSGKQCYCFPKNHSEKIAGYLVLTYIYNVFVSFF